MSTAVVAHPAATVVLLRAGARGCEVLLVRRNAQLSFHGGAWVFPGGRIDAKDYAAAASADVAQASRYAAVRETREETGLTVSSDSLVLFARWITPEESPKRFDAWFFAARAAAGRVQVDGGEIHEHRWMRPQDALIAQRSGEIDLPPPTFVTLHRLTQYATVAEALAGLACGPCEAFVPRIHFIPAGACSVYAGDAAYESGSLDQPGPRHRLWLLESGWHYERGDVPSVLSDLEQ